MKNLLFFVEVVESYLSFIKSFFCFFISPTKSSRSCFIYFFHPFLQFISFNSWLRWIQLILAFIISADIIKQFGTDSPVISGILIGCSLILTLINTITKSFDFNGRASRHIMTANALWDLREDYRSFKYDIQAGRYNEDELRINRRKQICCFLMNFMTPFYITIAEHCLLIV